MHNADIAAALSQAALLLELGGANPFRVRAYRNAARFIGAEAPPMADWVAEDRDLTELPSIGKEMAAHVRELVETGQLGLLDELGAEVPLGLIGVVALPGVGPKKAVRLWKELGIETVEALEGAAAEGRLADLPGFGRKTEQRILDAIQRRRKSQNRVRLPDAERQAAPLLELLRALPAVRQVEIAGSFRRRRETVGDLDILVVAADGEAVVDAFAGWSEIERVESAGETRATGYLRSGLQIDLRVVPAKSAGAAMIYFTGSKPHNIELRRRALARGMHLSEYGLFEESAEGDSESTGRFVAGKTEKAVYRALDLPWIAPELREDRGEVAAADEGRLPDLIQLDDLRGDLQMHSTWSDGKASIEEMARACAERGYDYLALTDHSPFLAMVGGLDANRLRLQRQEIQTVQERLPQIRILQSQEVDILADGSLDQTDEALEELDLVVAAVHSRYDLPPADQTRRMLRAVEHPAVDILAHPTGRKIGRRRAMELDLEEVLQAAAEHGVAVELNALPSRLDLKDTHLMRARALGVRVVISTDAHSVKDLDWMSLGVDQARRAWLEKGDVLNTLPVDELLAAFGKG